MSDRVTDGDLKRIKQDIACNVHSKAVEDRVALVSEIDAIRAELAEARGEYAIICRAIGNWREWPGKAETDHNHPDWKAAARALVERDQLRALSQPNRNDRAV